MMRAQSHGFELYDGCLTCKWRSENFFCDFPAETLEDFDARSYNTIYPQGAILFTEGQPARGIHMLCRGSAKMSISSCDGKMLIAHIAQAGEVLGLSSVLTAKPYKCSAETLEPSQVNFVRRDDFLRLLGQHHDAASNAVRQLGEDCEADMDHIRALGLAHSAAEKLANVILAWCAEKGTEGPGGLRVQMLMTHEDVSQLIGTSRETVTRLLKEFREKEIISIRGSTLTVRNRAALEALVLL